MRSTGSRFRTRIEGRFGHWQSFTGGMRRSGVESIESRSSVSQSVLMKTRHERTEDGTCKFASRPVAGHVRYRWHRVVQFKLRSHCGAFAQALTLTRASGSSNFQVFGHSIWSQAHWWPLSPVIPLPSSSSPLSPSQKSTRQYVRRWISRRRRRGRL